MKIINKCLSRKEFAEYIKDYNFGTLPANKLVIHHTWKPTKEQWNGRHSIQGLKSYYERKNWWAGPHLFIADDGIWLFTPMRKNGIHAGKGNWRSIGIEVVGDYDSKKWDGETKENTLFVIKALQEKLKINNEYVKFHRDYSRKSCPGHAITKEWLFKELVTFDKPKEVVKPPSTAKTPEWAKKDVAWHKRNKIISQFKKEGMDRFEIAVATRRLYDLLFKRLKK